MENFTKWFVAMLVFLTAEVNDARYRGYRGYRSYSSYYSSGYGGSWVVGVAVGCSIAGIALLVVAFIVIWKCVLTKNKPAMQVKPSNVVPPPGNTAGTSTVQAPPYYTYGQGVYPQVPPPPEYSAVYPPPQDPAYPPPPTKDPAFPPPPQLQPSN